MNTDDYRVMKLQAGETPPFNLLLLADETREAIDKYIYDAEVYVVFQSDLADPVATFVLCPVGSDVMEIKNIAVSESQQGKGIGKFLMHQIEIIAGNAGYQGIIVGTPDIATKQIRFYENNGYVKHSVRKNFFKENYTEPIFENGIRLKDMQMLHKKILGHQNAKNNIL